MNLDEKIKFLIKNLEQKKYNEVIIECETLIKNKQKNSEIYNIYGLALQKQRLFTKSIEALKESIKINPKNFIAMNNLGISLKNNFEIEEAEKNYLSCLKLKPNYVQALVNFSSLKEQKREIKESIELLQKAASFTSGFLRIDILTKLSYLNLVAGNFEQAKLITKKILEQDPNNIYALINISKFNDHKNNIGYIKKMEEIINSPNITSRGKILLFFAIGNIYEKLNNYEKAFSFFKKGNEIKRNSIISNCKDILELKNTIINFFEKFDFKKIKKSFSKKKVIFICGIPRSGTTLLEQIISSHSQVFSTGENDILTKIISDTFFKDNNLIKDNFDQEIQSSNNIQTHYFEELKKKFLFKENNITDKSMLNVFWIGFIKIFFPNSKILVLQRNSKDIFLSIFKNDFNSSFMNWAYSEQEITNIINSYLQIMSFFKKKIPDDLYFVEYNKLIEIPEIEIKNIIRFCNLDWDPNCLKHHQSSTPIQTASLFQARKPFYKSSINASENYINYFQDIFDKLN